MVSKVVQCADGSAWGSFFYWESMKGLKGQRNVVLSFQVKHQVSCLVLNYLEF